MTTDTIPRNALSAALKAQVDTARKHAIAVENDPAKDRATYYANLTQHGHELRQAEYALKLAEQYELALAKLIGCLQTVRGVDTSATPEAGLKVNGQPVPQGMSRWKTPRESAEHVLWELRHMGLVDAAEITEVAA